MAEIDIKSTAILIDELVTISNICFHSQDDIRNPNISQEERYAAAIRAQETNARRNKLIRKLDERFGDLELAPISKSYDK